MATPQPVAAPVGNDGWNCPSQAAPAPASPGPGPIVQEPGLHFRPMGLKVHYTFDKEAKVNCLARLPYTLHVQAIPIDEVNAIGVVDLRACVQAVIECSPELACRDGDYTIYAVDYSEPDSPLVGQGMLSWALDSMQGAMMSQQPKLVTGRVTRNLLGVFGGGNRETLEVKLKLSESVKVQRHVHHDNMDMQQSQLVERPVEQPTQRSLEQPMSRAVEESVQRHVDMVMTPTGASEWSSFIQSNPQFGHPNQVSGVASPALSQGPLPLVVSGQGSSSQLRMVNQEESFGPPASQEVQRVAPTPVEPTEQLKAPAASSRPSSRASSRAPRKKPPTGRPRGRPRKKAADGNTSSYEDATEGEEGPTKKRAKTIKADKSAANPFSTGPESLRVAASTSNSLRNFRPVAANEGASASHLQGMPRAPTPVPEGGSLAGLPGRGPSQAKLRRELPQNQHQAAGPYFESRLQPLSPGQEDDRSPESVAPTPGCSEASMASSPPMQRTTPFMQSSPPPSSPVLPPMPSAELQHHESSFANDEMDDLFGEEPLQPAPSETIPTQTHHGKPTDLRTANGVPIQVFQMQDGPMGQDMVHICSYNGAPHPAPVPAPAPPASSDVPCLPPLKKAPLRPRPKRAPAKKRPRPAAPPPPPSPPPPFPRVMEPTPPPTTDNVERPMSPALMAEAVQELAPTPMAELAQGETQLNVVSAAESMQAGVQPGESGNLVPDVSTEATISTTETPTQQQDQPLKESPQQKACQSTNPSKPRQLVRSQSVGPVALALPLAPGGEPAGPSFLSQSTVAEPDHPSPSAAPGLRRAASSGPLILPAPASDSIVPSTSSQQASNEEQPEASVLPSDAAPPASASSPPVARSNKNIVKKHAIKQRLEEAIMNGEMPPFCSNCGAIETPTWRKIWVQDHEGTPDYCEYSEKPGKVTAIEILKRDAEDNPTSYRLVKKSLGPADNKTDWQELLLCNPCGIWLTKCKCHRPPDRWDKDFSRIGQERRRKGTGRSHSRSKKSRSKSEGLANSTSEAYLPTDALESVEPSSPKAANGRPCQRFKTRAPSADVDSGNHSNLGSSHSRGSGTARSPVELDFDEAVGSTKRLLFPSPRKDGAPKVLGEVDVNMVQLSDELQQLKRIVTHMEHNTVVEGLTGVASEHDDLEALFTSPVAPRPSTPPATAAAKSKAEAPPAPFKTPTRPTPNHRPITRSLSRSLRSIRSIASPSQIFAQQTPTKTPRVAFGIGVQSSTGRRRSPRNHQGGFEEFDTPISRSISQIFSDPANFGLIDDLDLGSLPMMETNPNGLIDFGNLLSTDRVMPSSPPKDRSLSFDFHGSANIWAQWTLETTQSMKRDQSQ